MSQSSFRAARTTRQLVALIGLLFCAFAVLSAHGTASAAPSAAAGDLGSAVMSEETTGWD